MRLTLETPLEAVRGMNQRFLKHLARLGVSAVADLLYHFPVRYEDFSHICPVADLEPGALATVHGIVRDVALRRTWRRHITVVEAQIEDQTGVVRAVWFNQPYVAGTLRAGRLVNVSGKVAVTDGELYLSHPTYEFTGEGAERETRHTGRLVPVYPETKGLTSKGIRFLLQPLLKDLSPQDEWIPRTVLARERLPELNRALRDIHFPQTLEDAFAAKRRFAFEDLFLLQLSHLRHKLKLARERAHPIPAPLERVKQIVGDLPFTLTVSQKQSLWEVVQDIGKPRPMNRLLQGDVGSGKTAVAVIASLLAAEAGFQTALMAPTEVLARQHYETFKNLFARIRGAERFALGLITGSEAKIIYDGTLEAPVAKAKLEREIAEGKVQIAIGTHALLSRPHAMKRLGLVVIDEQHRFGVRQRAVLLGHETGRGKAALPHFLSMSATPIPRTLMLTIFGDLDISTITELPLGRKAIVTAAVPPGKRPATYDFIRKEIRAGRQAFVVCPRIEPMDAAAKGGEPAGPARFRSLALLETKSVKEEYEKLSKQVFPDLRLAMLHGQMKAKEKEKIMREFREGKIQVLVSTSVIEVGVDVPNASVMAIEGSDRFGLAQLYQLRGRVGRGAHQSYCFLFTDTDAKAASARLKAILEARNGFELAEKDLKLRGPGQFLGEAQTGLPDIAMEGLRDIPLIHESREAAKAVLKESASLAPYPLLREKLAAFEKTIHLE